MSKRYVLVHNCGHIVQPGDSITFEDNSLNRETRLELLGRTFEFVQTKAGSYDPSSRYVLYGERHENGELEVHVYALATPERFGCSIQEIDDDC